MNKIYKTIRKIRKLNESINGLDFEVNVADRDEFNHELGEKRHKRNKLIKKLRKHCQNWLDVEGE